MSRDFSTRRTQPAEESWVWRLDIAGKTVQAVVALDDLKTICETHPAGWYSIEVVDLLESPMLAQGDQILDLPTLMRRIPSPVRKIIGDLSNTEKVLVGLDLRPRTLV